jgi:hypothetical protein
MCMLLESTRGADGAARARGRAATAARNFMVGCGKEDGEEAIKLYR